MDKDRDSANLNPGLDITFVFSLVSEWWTQGLVLRLRHTHTNKLGPACYMHVHVKDPTAVRNVDPGKKQTKKQRWNSPKDKRVKRVYQFWTRCVFWSFSLNAGRPVRFALGYLNKIRINPFTALGTFYNDPAKVLSVCLYGTIWLPALNPAF